MAILLVIMGMTFDYFGPHIIDDAYITFRYARNLAAGDGLVYNIGERIQGSSTPLFSLLLGVIGLVGIDIPGAAVVIGVISALAALALVVVVGCRLGDESVGWLAAGFISMQFFWVIFVVSGMETMLYCALILGLLLAVTIERWKWVGVLVALTCLTRYDGAIAGAVALGVVLWRGGWRRFLIETGKAAAIYLPWFVFAWIYFSTPIPQSVTSKSATYNLDWPTVWQYYHVYVSFQPLVWLWVFLAVCGMVSIVRQRKSSIVFPLFFVLFLGAFVLSKMPITNFPWYLTPLLPVFFLMGVVGLREIANLFVKQRSGSGIQVLFAIVIPLLFLQWFTLDALRNEFGSSVMNREKAYRQTAETLEPIMKPGQSVYVGEVGTLGWFLPDAYIIDSAGLVSPHIPEIQRRHLQNSSGAIPIHDLARFVIQEYKPDFITTRYWWMGLAQLLDEPFFKDNYERLTDPRFDIFDQWMLRRITFSTEKETELSKSATK